MMCGKSLLVCFLAYGQDGPKCDAAGAMVDRDMAKLARKDTTPSSSFHSLPLPLPLQFPGEWRVYHTLQLKHPVDSLCWNREGTQLLVGGRDLSLWMLEQPPQTLATEVLPEREMSDVSEALMGGSGHGTWTEMWRCEMAVPVVHLKFSPDSLLFATAGEVRRRLNLSFFIT